MRRIAALVVLALLAAPGAARAAAGAPSLAAAAGTHFPDRSYALSLPEARSLRPGQVRVFENGKPVVGAIVRPADQVPASRFAVVLAIDTSGSMHGAPLQGAIDAARAFAAGRSPQQPLAVVAFDGAVRVIQPFTTDGAALERAIGNIRPTGQAGSRVFDAAEKAVALLRAAHAASGSVLLLTDGGDRGSRGTLDAVSRAAHAAGVRFFTVGLRSGDAKFGALNALAAGTSGAFSAASSVRDLANVFGALGARLAHQYLIEYRSTAAPHTRVHIRVEVSGFSTGASATYVTPALDRAAGPPYHEPPSARLWASPTFALAACLLVACLLASAMWLVARPRGRTVRERLRAYVSGAEAGQRERRATITGRRPALPAAARSLDRAAWWAAFKERCEIGRVSVSAERLAALTGVATLVLLVLLPLAVGPLGILVALLTPLGTLAYVKRHVDHQRRLFADQLPDNLQVIASAMRAGHSFTGALQVVVEDAPEPARGELTTVIADERLGVPLEEAFATVVRRMQSKDLEQVALVAALQRETGGNTAEVIDRVNHTMRERLELRRLVSALTAQGRLSRWVLTAIPIVLLVLMTLINPTYMLPLYSTPLGRTLLVVAALMVTAGSLVIKRIVNIKV